MKWNSWTGLIIFGLILGGCGVSFEALQNPTLKSFRNNSKPWVPPYNPIPVNPVPKSLTIEVYGADGVSVAGASVEIKKASTGQTLSLTTTNSSGSVQFTLLQDQYLIRARSGNRDKSLAFILINNSTQRITFDYVAPPPVVENDFDNRVWFTSNVATPDFLDMFSDTNAWTTARSRIQIMQFYAQQLLADEPSQCQMCGNNIYPNFMARNAFSQLKNWNIQVAAEMGSVKPWDCDASKNTDGAINMIQRLKDIGSHLRYFSMDEPFLSGREYCGQNAAQTADHVSNYMKNVKSAQANIAGRNFGIGLIAPYPYHSSAEIQEQVRLLADRGTLPTYLHMDVDRNHMKNANISDTRFRSDMDAIKNLLVQYNIPFGILFNGADVRTAANYRNSALSFVDKARVYSPNPHHAILQSWEATPGVSYDERKYPLNLPEGDIYSHMGILLEALYRLGI